jgi:hypothetical protein
VRNLGGFQLGGCTTLRSLARFGERRRLLGKGASRFSSVWSLASFVVYSGGGYPSSLFPGAWHELEERGVHLKKWFSLFTGPDLHRLS